MSILVFANNATTTLSVAALSSATSIVVTNGAVFPSPAGGQYFILTLTSVSTGSQEICWCTARSGNTLTIARGKEGTAPQSFLVGDHVDMYPTGGTQQALVQIDQLQNGTYTTATAGGTANALTANIISNLTAIPNGFTIIVLATAANTGASTLQVTLTSPITGTPTVTPTYNIYANGNTALASGIIPSAGFPCLLTYSSVYGGFELINGVTSSLVSIAQLQAQGYVYAGSVTGTADAIGVTVAAGGITTLIDGARVAFKAGFANTSTAPTLNVTYGSTATGARTIYKFNGQALVAADIAGSGAVCECTYNSTYSGWILTNPRTNYDVITSVTGSTGISASPTTGAVVVTNTGVTSLAAGSGINLSGSTGAVTITSTGLTTANSGTGIGIATSGSTITVTNTGLVAANAGTGIGVTTSSGTVTITNNGVTSLNGNTGVITGIPTLSGTNNFTGTNSFSNNISAATFSVNGGGFFGNTSLQVGSNSGYGIYLGGTTISMITAGGANAVSLTSSNIFATTATDCYKNGTSTSWILSSDARLKQNVTAYTRGLAEVNQIVPKNWEYNGLGGTPKGYAGIGAIADELQLVMPDMVGIREALLNPEDTVETQIKTVDVSELPWLLVNAVKELYAQVTAQAAEIAALKTKVGI